MKWVLGGLGGLTPLVANLLILDVAILDSYIIAMFNPDPSVNLELAGYCFKGVLLFLVGGFWAAILHSDEQNNLKLFQLGVVAPAIIVGFMNSAEIREIRKHDPKNGSENQPVPHGSENQPVSSLKVDSSSFALRVNERSPITTPELIEAFGIASVYAETSMQYEEMYKPQSPLQRALRSFGRGFLGRPMPQFETVDVEFETLNVGPGDCNVKTLTLRDNKHNEVFEISVINNCSYIDWTTEDSIAKSAAAATGLSRAGSRWALLSRGNECDNMLFTLYDKQKRRIVQSTVKDSCSKFDFKTLPWQIAEKVAELNRLD